MTDFEEKVAEMRRLQKLYFRERDKYILMECKKAESEVDEFLETGKSMVIQDPNNKMVACPAHPRLF